MVGVSNPMIRHEPRAGLRFLLGFAVGAAAAVMLLSLCLMALAELASLLPEEPRSSVLLLVLIGLGVADLFGRTPHVWRQVPQRLVRALRPGRLGVVWALDLGTLVTTQKATSLIWAALAGLILTGASASLPLAVGFVSATFLLGLILLSVYGEAWIISQSFAKVDFATWYRTMRLASGFVILSVAAVQVSAL